MLVYEILCLSVCCTDLVRLAPVLQTFFHQCVISYTCSQTNSDVTDLVRLAPVLQTFFHQCVISYTCSQTNSDGSVLILSHQS